MTSLPPREIMEELADSQENPFAVLEKSTPTAPSTQDPQEHIASMVMQRFEEAQRYRAALETEVNVFRAVLAGNQDIYRDVRTGELVSIVNQKSRRLWSRNNKVDVLNRALGGKITRAEISFKCRPGPYDSTTVEGCQLADRWLEFWSQKEDLPGKHTDACFELGAAGVGYLQLYFDPDGGARKVFCFECGFTDREAPPDVPCPVCQQGVLESVREGDIKVRHLDFFNVYWHPGVLRFEDSPYCIVRYPVPVINTRMMFPHIADHIAPEPDMYPSTGVRYTYASGYQWSEDALRDHTFIYEWYERPSPMYPEGRCLKVVNKRLAEAKPGYFGFLNRFPIFAFKWFRTPGSLYPKPPMADAWHRQRELNENETASREADELTSKPKALIPIQSKMAVDEITAATAQTILVDRASIDHVKYLVPPELSQGHYARRNELIGDMREMFGVTAQEAGAPVDPNGKVLAIQSAESDQTLGPVIRQHNAELGALALCALAMAQRYTSADTIMQLAGDESLLEGSFRQINFEPGFNVMVESDDGFSKNQSVRVQEVYSGVQLGLFGMPGTPDFKPWLAAKVARLKIPGLMPDLNRNEFAAARRAINDLEKGIQWQPAMQDDPAIWATACMDWLRDPQKGRNRALMQSKPWLLEGVQQMQMYYNQALLFAQQQAMIAQGGGVPVSNAGAPGTSAPGGTPAPTNGDTSVVSQAKQTEQQANRDASAASEAIG